MKTIATIIAALAMTFGAATQVEAREYRGDIYRTTIVVTGRDHRGNPVYAERYFIRMNAHGRPLWGYRPLPSRGGRGYDRDRDYRDREYIRGDRYDESRHDHDRRGRR